MRPLFHEPGADINPTLRYRILLSNENFVSRRRS
jgi:hypothetical protein